ncbi:GNAT family N-acetyltransferase [Massilia sp. IC2-278]|jgi:GNAT superfamily N-acetyltransferase|uniref:GNAT family N-acetyltransferase n=1 Tax=Massilia sp. IC2-278 TaxID=2887200 RepID=UPI000E9401FD|nr:GNAT family N-acetyltransferase [Massilia sp. IC2-278]MCC2961064.1 GNAT family N-acetyltransferase [Massilia sp. IC2-278]HBI70757.1 GNAT family N-acetyltransferase [Massilia sp.]
MTSATHFSIRPAEPADVTDIHSMIVELAVFEKLEHMVVATEELLHEGLFGNKPACEAIVGEENGEVVAFALFFHNFSTFLTKKGLYLEDLYVRQSHRGKGYGTQLLARLAQLAVERNCGRFEWSVLDWNEPAIGFYQTMGAEILPEWRICRVTGEALDHLARRGL